MNNIQIMAAEGASQTGRVVCRTTYLRSVRLPPPVQNFEGLQGG